MNRERRNIINSYIQSKGEVTLKQLQSFYPEISAMTLRRDLEYLEQTHKIIRTRGGA